jgi:hypothetical protein
VPLARALLDAAARAADPKPLLEAARTLLEEATKPPAPLRLVERQAEA